MRIQKINFTVFWLLALVILLPLAYGSFRLYRWVNWNFGYQEMVKTTITEMVKQECLKD